MNFGYARISTQDQNLALQQEALEQAGCERILTDMAPGAKADRPGLMDVLSHVRAGGTLTVQKRDRLGRSLKQLIEVAQDLDKRGVGLRSLQEKIITTSSGANWCSMSSSHWRNSSTT